MKSLKQRNDRIDSLLQTRQDSLYHYARSMRDLLEMGVKIGSGDEIEVPENFAPYMERYNRSLLEFEWEVEYTDGSILQQWPTGGENHFGHIDQSRIKRVSWISNFTWQTDNVERRVIVTLDWATGLFSFLNGYCPQEVQAKVSVDEIPGPKQLILLMKRRTSSSVGDIADDLKNYHPPTNLVFYYNQFVLGFQSEGIKRCVIVLPNGTVDLFEN